jgi:ankyrin repeat protein
MTAVMQNKIVQLRQIVRKSRARLKRLEQERAELEKNLKQVDESLEAFANADPSTLIRAAEKGDARAVREQLKAGADPNARNADSEPVLLLAVSRQGNLPVVRELLKAGAAVDDTDDAGNTALIVCAHNDHLLIVKELVKRGANVNAKNLEGDTPLTNAAIWGSAQVVKYLLAHSADPELTDGLNVSAAELARQQGHKAIVRLLS